MMNICICGGGSLGHVCAGVLASHPGVSVRIHSRQPERWADTLRIADPAGKTYVGRLATVTADYARAVADCQMVFLCLPGYAIAPTLQALAPHLPQVVPWVPLWAVQASFSTPISFYQPIPPLCLSAHALHSPHRQLRPKCPTSGLQARCRTGRRAFS